MKTVEYWEQTCSQCDKTFSMKAQKGCVPFPDFVHLEHKTVHGRTTADLCSPECLKNYVEKKF